MSEKFPDPISSYNPKRPVVPQQASSPAASSELTSADLARLEQMSKDELIALIKRVSCAMGHIALMSKEETAQAMRDVLAETALRPIVAGTSVRADIMARMTAIDKWLDRSEGKAAQVVSMNVQGSIENKVMLPATRRFLESFIEPVTIEQ